MMMLLPKGDSGGVVASLEKRCVFDRQRSVRICRDSSGGRRERISNGISYVLVCGLHP